MVLICTVLSMMTVRETLFLKEVIQNLPRIPVGSGNGTRLFHTVFCGLRTVFFMQHLKAIRWFLTSDDAATAVEYAVMLAMILVAIIIGVTTAGGAVSAWWGNIRTDLVNYGS